MRLFKTAAMAALLCLISSAAQASSEQAAHIINYTPQRAGQTFFGSNGQRSSVPSCATVSNRWVIDSTTMSGQALIAGMITAYALGKTLTISGTGDCSVWSDTETVSYFTVY